MGEARRAEQGRRDHTREPRRGDGGAVSVLLNVCTVCLIIAQDLQGLQRVGRELEGGLWPEGRHRLAEVEDISCQERSGVVQLGAWHRLCMTGMTGG